MELISLPRLRLKELQTMAENTLLICAPIEEVSSATQKVKNTLDTFKRSMLKDQASAATKLELDKTRDRLVSGFKQDVRAEQYYPHQEVATIETLENVRQVMDKYGPHLTKLTYSEESAAIDNMLTELKQVDTLALEGTGIDRWIPLIENANNAFKNAASNYVSQSAKAMETQAATTLVPALMASLDELYTLLFAHVKITQSDQLKTAYAELEELVDAYR